MGVLVELVSSRKRTTNGAEDSNSQCAGYRSVYLSGGRATLVYGVVKGSSKAGCIVSAECHHHGWVAAKPVGQVKQVQQVAHWTASTRSQSGG